MQNTYLGRSGLRVSRLCLGTMNFGTRTSQAEAFKIMDRALELGINFFDTADVYGPANHHGLTEEIIGNWFALGNHRRERVVLATKTYEPMDDSLAGPNDARGISAYKIYRHLDASLRRLQTDHVELYQMHHVDPRTNWNEIYGALENVIQQGKVYYVGSSNFGARHLAYAKAAADNRHFLGLISEQHRYNLLCRLPELEVLPAAQEIGMGVLTWSPLAGGLLADHLLSGNPDPQSRRAAAVKNLTAAQRVQFQRYADLCADLEESESTIALAWLLANPAVTAPVIGPRTVAQLEHLVHALDVHLSEDVLAELDEIFPGPGGAAPEAYAW
ncbi:aldo/keto reductase [Lactiplantibacillus garii]|uniref:Aldo/keto reductase n=1 Tax=Lactiplantibacillus garii TaxID=2306423 RepID=A0A426D532_9LACO|nr:aldo/keto reductase [Lactiplantibacillus garii]RRK09765.1 aldo/keto reductase [Lactiplantibacillus garii]